MDYGFGHAVDSNLLPRPVLAIRVTRGGLEPSAIEYAANFPTSLTGDVTSERKTGNEAAWIPDERSRIPDSLSMELGIRIQSLEGFRILGAVFRISKRGIPDSTAKI